MGIIRKSYRFVPWSQRFFLIFLLERDQEQAAKAATTSRESDEEREKNFWLPWPPGGGLTYETDGDARRLA